MRKAAAFLLCLLSFPVFGVYVGSSGFGQALIYPYYTVQSVDGNAFNTYISIANGHSQPKALRVRLREGRNAGERASFNLFLPAHGIWAAAIFPSGSGAVLATIDPACTAPAFDGDPNGMRTLTMPTGDSREGYVEVFEMASFPGALPACDSLRANLTGTLSAPQGYLYGMETIINVNNGMDFTVNAVGLGNLAQAPYFRPPSDPYPDFNASEIGRVAMFTRNDKMYRVTMGTSVAAVEVALIVARVSNELVLDAGTASATDWVLTFPTRRFAQASSWFAAATENGEIRLAGEVTPRSGAARTLVLTCAAGLCSGGETIADIRAPYAATVLGFQAIGGAFSTTTEGVTGALGSRNSFTVGLPMAPGGANLELRFARQGAGINGYPAVSLAMQSTRIGDGAVLGETIQLAGLPVVGFMARTFRNGTLACSAGTCQGNYGGTAPHRLRRVVDPANDP